MKQYKTIKEKCKDAIILFRVGEVYETFDDDAKTAANILGGSFLSTKGEEGETSVIRIPH